jgi:ribonuclease G
MLKEIIISSTASQNRIAITEDRKLVDFFVEHPEKDRMVGNIYLGKVARVLPGIRAVFINIGLKHDAFLHFSDIGDSLKDNLNFVDDDYVAEPDVKEEVKNSKPDSENGNVENQEVTKARIPRLKKGQEVLVQIIKEPVKGKGVRVSTSISIPGRFCVLIPYEDKIGISKKITDYREKKRLKKLARGIIPSNCGLIVRTASKDQPEDSLSSDLKYLSNTWVQVQDEVKKNSPPYLVYKDLSTTISVIRDLFTTDVSNIFIDSKKLYKEIRAYVNTHQPDLVDKVNLYKSSNPIDQEFNVDEHI